LRLSREILALETLLHGPTDLAGDEHLLAVRGDAVGITLRSRPRGRLQYFDHRVSWRRRKRCSFPVSVRGSVVRNSMRRGYLYGAMDCLTKSCSSRASASLPAKPSRRITNAATTWPRSSSASPTTPHSATAGCASNAPSTSGPAML